MSLPCHMLTCLVAALVIGVPAIGRSQSCPAGMSLRDVETLTHKTIAYKAMSQGSGLGAAIKTPLQRDIAGLTSRIVQIFACQSMINHYASNLGMPSDIVEEVPYRRHHGNADELHFTNKTSHEGRKDVCGSIRFEMRRGLPGHEVRTKLATWRAALENTQNQALPQLRSDGATAAENAAYKEFTDDVLFGVIDMLPDLEDLSDNMISPFLPGGKNLPLPSDENVLEIANAFQDRLVARFIELAGQRKWSGTEVAHFATVAQCAPILPVATGPDEEVFKSYQSAFADYIRLKAVLDEALKQ